MKALVKYPGAKWRIADWVIDFFPAHHSYVEPFFGSGAVFFKKSRSSIETVNDLDGEVVNLFECVQCDPERLAQLIYWIPYARQVYEQACIEEPQNAYQRAAAFLVRCNMGHGFRTAGEKVGWKVDVQGRERAYAAKDWTELPERIRAAAERLRGVQIEHRAAVDLIQHFNYPNVLIYADPPYVRDSRSCRKAQYKCEMTDSEHRDLLDALLAHRGHVILSGYQSKLYADALQGWHVETIMERAQCGRQCREMLWMNFRPEKQLSLLEDEGVME